jgi:N,N'-diacetyllegionaminate synthase
MTFPIRLGDHFIGNSEQPFIVAEAGVNHNGNFDIAKKMIDAAKEAGVDAIKFQTFKAEQIATKYADTASYQVSSTGELSQLPMLKKLELNYTQFYQLKQYCEQKDLVFLSTPLNRSDIDALIEMGVSAFKIASPDLISLPMLEYLSLKGKPIFLSTGMANMEEISEAVKSLGDRFEDLVLMQCTSSYPCAFDFVNLSAMEQIRTLGFPVGYSDHSLGIGCAMISAYLGACIIEKHFTLSRDMKGPDHSLSLEPNELRSMVEAVKIGYSSRCNDIEGFVEQISDYDLAARQRLKQIIGNGTKTTMPPEYELIPKVRKSVVPTRFIPKGSVIPPSIFDVWEDYFAFKRPGGGLAPKMLYCLLGKMTKRDLSPDQAISISDFDGAIP